MAIVEVADLVGKNYSGLSDPFVEVEVLGLKKKTRFQKELTSCVFDDTFYFNFYGEWILFYFDVPVLVCFLFVFYFFYSSLLLFFVFCLLFIILVHFLLFYSMLSIFFSSDILFVLLKILFSFRHIQYIMLLIFNQSTLTLCT